MYISLDVNIFSRLWFMKIRTSKRKRKTKKCHVKRKTDYKKEFMRESKERDVIDIINKLFRIRHHSTSGKKYAALNYSSIPLIKLTPNELFSHFCVYVISIPLDKTNALGVKQPTLIEDT